MPNETSNDRVVASKLIALSKRIQALRDWGEDAEVERLSMVYMAASECLGFGLLGDSTMILGLEMVPDHLVQSSKNRRGNIVSRNLKSRLFDELSYEWKIVPCSECRRTTGYTDRAFGLCSSCQRHEDAWVEKLETRAARLRKQNKRP